VLAIEVVWLVFYARGLDTYYNITRWEFAERDGNQWFVVAAIVMAAAAIAGLLAGVVSPRRWLRRVAAADAAVASVLVLVAAFVLSVGH
jgi:hypothetical protein